MGANADIRPRARDLVMTDVAGVKVDHVTLIDGEQVRAMMQNH